MSRHVWSLLLGVMSLLSPFWVSASTARNNLDSLINNEKLKFVFVGGKGGVGKTTTSSAIAAQLSLSLLEATKSNRRVLLISTDPAHSLSDAFRMKFSNVPTPIMPDLPNLEVMEVNPTETMKKELSGWVGLAKELGYDPTAKEEEGGSIGEKIHSFQDWLSGIPGIDEATALSSAIEHIESGRYDMIVFDTAPTGHTLKLLELPKILQVGLDKLESWQATLWGYWEMIKGLTGGSADHGIKDRVAQKLKDYKASISRVSNMITDTERTRFVVVCIAEYLSISESRRLLSELDRFKVVASHIVVNQLVTDYLEEDDFKELEELIPDDAPDHAGEKWVGNMKKALKAARLTTARRNIQVKYLKELKKSPEVKRTPDPEAPDVRTNSQASDTPLTVLEVPLLPSEVTGPKAILDFSHLLIGKDLEKQTAGSVGVEGERSKKARAKEASSFDIFNDGDDYFERTLRERGEDPAKFAAKNSGAKKKEKMPDMKGAAETVMKKVMADKELAAMIEKSPKLKKIVQEVEKNPMAAMKYMSDPEVMPFMQKAVKVIMPGMEGLLGGLGGGATGGKKRRRRKQQNDDPMAALAGLGDLLKGMEL